MIGAFKGCGSRVVRGVTTPTSVLTFEPCNFQCKVGFGNSVNNLNWSQQRRFLRGQPPSTSEGCDTASDKKDVKQEENFHDMPSLSSLSLSKFSRSLRGYQMHLLSSLPNTDDKQLEDLIGVISKLIVENGPASVRVKTRKHEDLLTEWIGIQNELRIVKQDRVEDDRKKLQIAGQQVLREMARLTKSINLDDLDQAIEGALCSQAKSDYGQQKWRDH